MFWAAENNLVQTNRRLCIREQCLLNLCVHEEHMASLWKHRLVHRRLELLVPKVVESACLTGSQVILVQLTTSQAPALHTERLISDDEKGWFLMIKRENWMDRTQDLGFFFLILLFCFLQNISQLVLLLFFQSPCLPMNALNWLCSPGWTWTWILTFTS